MSLEPLDIDLNQHRFQSLTSIPISYRQSEGKIRKKIELKDFVGNVNLRLKFRLIEKIEMQIRGIE